MADQRSRSVQRTTSGSGSSSTSKRGQKQDASFSSGFRYVMFIVGISLALSVFLLIIANDVLALTRKDQSVTVVLEEGMSTGEIAKILKENDVIAFPWMFRMFSAVTQNDGKYQYGTYDLNKSQDYLALITTMKRRANSEATVWITIPEGKELREIFEMLEKNGVCTSEELTKTMKTEDLGFDFLKQIPKRDNGLEGYLFPDTYEFYKGEKSASVLKKFLRNFENKYDESCSQRAAEIGMTMDQVVTLASIVEREAANDMDRGLVASVFLNRLKSKEYPYLQSCATVQYVLKDRKSVLSIADTKIDSKYNTYLYKGLPIGPIASPGKASIEAVLWPDESDYYFFVVGEKGQHIFSKTLVEHNQAVKKASTSGGTGAVKE